MLRLTNDERAVAEVAAIAEHVASLTAAAAAFRLSPDVPLQLDGPNGIVPLVDDSCAGEVADTLAEIRDWTAAALGVAHAPAIWRALAHDPRLLNATWRGSG